MSLSSPERSSGIALDRPTEPSPNEPKPRRGSVRLTHSSLAAALALVATPRSLRSARRPTRRAVSRRRRRPCSRCGRWWTETRRCRTVACASTRRKSSALLQSNGKAQERAYGSGIALMEFTRLPSDFTVEVSGARPGGRPLRGTFRAVVHGYTAGRVVHVDPVTTLIAARRQRGRPISAATARSKIYRLLRVPGWQDEADLRNRTTTSTEAYLRAARRPAASRRSTGRSSARSCVPETDLGDS